MILQFVILQFKVTLQFKVSVYRLSGKEADGLLDKGLSRSCAICMQIIILREFFGCVSFGVVTKLQEQRYAVLQ